MSSIAYGAGILNTGNIHAVKIQYYLPLCCRDAGYGNYTQFKRFLSACAHKSNHDGGIDIAVLPHVFTCEAN